MIEQWYYLSMKLKGFTLLELVIVIIIIGVLTSLALPRLFGVVESARSAEALSMMASIRRTVEICYLQKDSWQDCVAGPLLFLTEGYGFPERLGIPYPGEAPNSHFEYQVFWTLNPPGYVIKAARNTRDGGAAGFTDQIHMNVLGSDIGYCGSGAFENVGDYPPGGPAGACNFVTGTWILVFGGG